MALEYMEIREQMTDICRRMWQLGWVAANDGNISVKLEDGSFLTTPTGISKGFITPEMLVHMDAQGQNVNLDGRYRPSSEWKMHLRCYEKKAEVGAVVHAHPPVSTAYAVAQIPLDEYSLTETVLTMGSVPIAPYATPTTSEVPDSVEPFLECHDAILLQSHGALTMGEDLISAYYRMESLEHFAKISLYAKLLGGAKELPKEEISKLLEIREQLHSSGRHPGYRKYGNS